MLNITNKNLLELKEKFGDAFYLLDSLQFEKNFKELKEAFSKIYSNFNIAYSYKTNYTPKLCKIVNELGGYAEVVSEMELELALRVGASYDKIIWNGPVKNEAILEKFIINGGTVNIDSIEEKRVVERIVKNNPTINFNLGIRCNFDVYDDVVSRFGFDVDSEEFDETLNFILNTPNARLINLQSHFAKRQIQYWPNKAKGMLDLIDRIGVVPPRIDLGGGLFGKMDDQLKKQFSCSIPNYDEYANAVATLVADRFKNLDQKPELIIEPGSALVGDCMQFIGTVKTIKNVRGEYIATLLASQKNISMTGVNPPITIYPLSNDRKEYTNLKMVGFTCIEGDILYKGYSGLLGNGDMVGFGNCGSYSIVMKPPFILPNFPILDISHGDVEVIKRAETFDDIFHTYKF